MTEPATPNIAIVGATGAVGQELLTLLHERSFPFDALRLITSARSKGKTLHCGDASCMTQELTTDSFEGIDIAFFSAGGEISTQYAPIALQSGATVIDNSSAFRMDDRFPLVVPEINSDAIQPNTIIANPNCSTIILLMAITPIRTMYGINRICVSTYQAASGAGAAAMRELENQTKDVLAGLPAEPHVFDQVCAFNVFSHNTPIGADGYNTEETKMVQETHKIWDDHDIAITATCIRVPVLRAHCESVNLTLDTPISEDDLANIRNSLHQSPGLRLLDNREHNLFPTPETVSGVDEVYIGRLRLDQSQMIDNTHSQGLELFIAGDQIRKGAALNAIQIAEHLT